MKKSQLDLPAAMIPSSVAPPTPFNAAVVVASNSNRTNPAAHAHGAHDIDVDAANGIGSKQEERRHNAPYFVQKPMTQTIPVKLPDNVIELLKGQARQKGISLQALIKSTLAASVASAVAEEQS